MTEALGADQNEAARKRRRHMTFAAGAAALIALGGCGATRDMTMQAMGVPELPESASVADAPWPRLVDSPAPVPTELGLANNFQSQIARGEAIEADVAAGATGLSEQAAGLTEQPPEATALQRDVAALRREVDALRASDVE